MHAFTALSLALPFAAVVVGATTTSSSAYSASTGTSSGVCKSNPYKDLLGLANIPIVDEYCDLRYPQNRHVKTETVTMSESRVARPHRHTPAPVPHKGKHDRRSLANWESALSKGESFISTLCSCIEDLETATVTQTIYQRHNHTMAMVTGSPSSVEVSAVQFTPSAEPSTTVVGQTLTYTVEPVQATSDTGSMANFVPTFSVAHKPAPTHSHMTYAHSYPITNSSMTSTTMSANTAYSSASPDSTVTVTMTKDPITITVTSTASGGSVGTAYRRSPLY